MALREPDGWEMLFVDDGSTDATLPRSWPRTAPTRGSARLSLSRNFGKEAALTAGLDHAGGQAVIPLDVDLQDPPEVIGEMVQPSGGKGSRWSTACAATARPTACPSG